MSRQAAFFLLFGSAALSIAAYAKAQDNSFARLDHRVVKQDGAEAANIYSGDNEITGIIVSDGDASVQGLLGTKVPNLADKSWRMFFTQQHGDNTTFEVTRTNTM